MPLDGQYCAAGQSQAGVILVSAKAFPQDRSSRSAILPGAAAIGWTKTAQTEHDLRYWNERAKGGHFAAFEQPAIFVDEVRAAFRSFRAG